MFKNRHLLLVTLIIVFIMYTSSSILTAKQIERERGVEKNMIVTSSGIINGIIDKKYGKYGAQFSKGIPTHSIPLTIKEYPKDTKTFAIIMEDKDAIPVVGFSWLHWSVANLTKDSLEENASINAKDFIQGTNSWSSSLLPQPLDRDEAAKYGGPTPPDKNHDYEIHVFALDTSLDLHKGFYVNELYKAMDGHILAQYTLKAIYTN
ncbi:YbhB/YbcL family Raf kinase inhibitor-like protein [Pelosinus sp. IPA-1]|uniref:YbhB/YbcL family Raf kinase inhibitor-like protein n=1 Tax=Pelosinus sp. IPA-1 TaxID=3029569 RepID=UPI00243619F2|nr:YbhB/YbcL family Raf kinase inhibitor-like protein [Pelosinus sp. IPA-1]GMA97714.1 phosphatidylethanolamine-binding protein [Pelosinus sp. IPA-1]